MLLNLSAHLYRHKAFGEALQRVLALGQLSFCLRVCIVAVSQSLHSIYRSKRLLDIYKQKGA